MLGIIVGLIVVLVVYFLMRDEFWDGVLSAGFGVMFGGVAALIVIPMTGGLMPEYSQGERNGYVTKLSHKGMIFKTWDGELQVGSGNMSALQEPFGFSVPDEKVREIMYEAADEGYRVKLRYNQYLIANYRVGEHTSIITDIEILDDKE